MGKIKIVVFLILLFIIYKVFISVKNFETNLDKQVAEIEKWILREKMKLSD